MRKLFFLFIASLLINLSKAQNVGIGTTTPAKPLDVALPGGIQISRTENASSSNEIFFSDNGQIRSLDSFHRIVFNRSNDQLEFKELGKILFYTGNPLAEAMRITNNGYIGIGTSLSLSPNNLLSVAGGITIDYNNQNNGTIANSLSFGSSGGEGIGSPRTTFPVPVNAHGLDFYTNYTKRVSIDAGGNVGIGTATPGAKLDVEGNVKIADGTQGDGKVLTSDVDGNAYWKGAVGFSAYIADSIINLPVYYHPGNTGIIFSNVLYDYVNNYNSSTGIFVTPFDGLFNFSGCLFMQFTGTLPEGDVCLELLVNGSLKFLSCFPSPFTNNYFNLSPSTDLKLNAADQVQWRVYNGTSANNSLRVIGPSSLDRISVHLVK